MLTRLAFLSHFGLAANYTERVKASPDQKLRTAGAILGRRASEHYHLPVFQTAGYRLARDDLAVDYAVNVIVIAAPNCYALAGCALSRASWVFIRSIAMGLSKALTMLLADSVFR